MKQPLTPEEYAAAARERILQQARKESWPQSVDVGRALGIKNEAAARRLATQMRNKGELLGLWSPDEHTFYHPPFQFLLDGRVHPRWPELLTALASIPTYAPTDDPTGWGRLDWLLQPTGALTERSLAFAHSSDGCVPNDDQLSSEPRMPAEVFPLDPQATIAQAQSDAREIAEGR